MKKMLILCLIVVLITPIYTLSAEEALSDMTLSFEDAHDYHSEDLYFMNLALIEAYPELLEMEVIGYSYDHQPIYVIRLSESLKQTNLYVNKMHGLIESGTHAREVANPVLTSMMLYEYVQDYINDDYLPEINVHELLQQSVLHFVINSNPDGYNISKFGKASIKSETAYVQLLSVHDKDYSNYKANSRGVDLNRNYPDIYYNLSKNQWVNQWAVKQNSFTSNEPSGAYFFGYEPASEIETTTMMAYLMSYDFRYYLSYHSKGEVIYGDYYYLESNIRNQIKSYTTLASNITGYPIPRFYDAEVSSGYMGNYIVNNTLKPAVTIETIPYNVTLPNITSNDLEKAYEDTYTLPYAFMRKALSDGYYNYRLYVNNRYVRDYSNESYALAVADQLGGIIIERGKASPTLYLTDTVSREEFLVALLGDVDLTQQPLSDEIMFEDTQNETIHYAKSNGIVNGYMNQFYPNRNISYLEAAITLYRYELLQSNDSITVTRSNKSTDIENDTVPTWALDAVLYCIDQGYMSPSQAYNTYLNRSDFHQLIPTNY